VDDLLLILCLYYIAALLHEMAHALVAFWCGVRVKGICFKWGSLAIVREPGGPIANLSISLAGPILSLLLAFLAWPDLREFAWANLCVGFCNLLPIRGSDGDRAISCMETLGWVRRARRIDPRLRWLRAKGYSDGDLALLSVADDRPKG
jgi:Zn-dependent protease